MNTASQPFRCLVLFVSILLLTAGIAPSQERLRWKFEDNQTIDYEIVQKMNMHMSVQGQNVDTTMDQTMNIGWHVKNVEADGSARIEQTVRRVRLTMKNPFLNVEYDSDKPDEAADEGPAGNFKKIFGALVGKTFKLTMTPQGAIEDMELPEGIEEALPKAQPGFAAPLDKESLKRLSSQANIAFPAEPVKKGETWGDKADVKLPFGTMVMDNQFTYLGPEERDGRTLQKIQLKPKITLAADPDSPVQIKLKSTDAKGTILFDNQLGRLVASEMTQKMEMDLTAGGQNIQQTIDQTMTMKAIDGRERK
ncbi:MAG: hypothetical protein KY476_20515 [Planctomycetes bacterium]|nr:hypothetical protein [Planctomycetota bacterium]